MIGSKIRMLRQSKGMTLNELAKQTQTTAGYLSQLERDIADPSLSTLRKIASVLDTPLFALLDSQDRQSEIIYANKRQKISFSDSNIIYEVLSPQSSGPENGTDLLVLTYKLAPKSWSSSERISHNAEECIYVQEGTLEVLVGDQTYVLHEGDSIYIMENAPHNIYNPGPRQAVGVSAMCPAVFISTVRP